MRQAGPALMVVIIHPFITALYHAVPFRAVRCVTHSTSDAENYRLGIKSSSTHCTVHTVLFFHAGSRASMNFTFSSCAEEVVCLLLSGCKIDGHDYCSKMIPPGGPFLPSVSET